MATGKVTGVSRTAIGVAGLRAIESERPDRLFEDPYAMAFVAGAHDVLDEADPIRSGAEAERGAALFAMHIAVRTRFYDDYLRRAAEAGCGQVVLLAAGLDTRAFRLAWPDGVRLFELDLPELVDYKERVLAEQAAVPRCERTVVPVDLREDWPARLESAGLRAVEPTAWLIEGLLVYLSAEDAAGLLTRVGDLSAPGSQLSCEYRDSAQNSLLSRARATPELNRVTELWKGGLGADLDGWLARNGWRVRIHDGADLAGSYGRPDPDAGSVSYLTAVREPADS